MKTCSKCKADKIDGEFQIRKASADGLTSRCKQCLSEYDKERANNPHRIRARKIYEKTQKGIDARKKARAKYEKANKKKILISHRKYRENNPKKHKAHNSVAYAIKTKKLSKKPCEVCGAKKADAHHDNYDQPLDVRWLCAKHHRQWHVENGEALNAA